MEQPSLSGADKAAAMRDCHLHVACPHCGAVVGQHCWRTVAGSRGLHVETYRPPRQDASGDRPHRARWIQLIG